MFCTKIEFKPFCTIKYDAMLCISVLKNIVNINVVQLGKLFLKISEFSSLYLNCDIK